MFEGMDTLKSFVATELGEGDEPSKEARKLVAAKASQACLQALEEVFLQSIVTTRHKKALTWLCRVMPILSWRWCSPR